MAEKFSWFTKNGAFFYSWPFLFRDGFSTKGFAFSGGNADLFQAKTIEYTDVHIHFSNSFKAKFGFLLYPNSQPPLILCDF